MRRRDIVKRIGTAGAITLGGAGVASGDESTQLEWEFDDGRVERMTVEEFDAHPETPTAAEIRASDTYALSGCCDCGYTGDMACDGCLIVCDTYAY